MAKQNRKPTEKELREIRFKVIISMLSEDSKLAEQVKVYLK